MSEWISVEDRLPVIPENSKGVRVDVWVKSDMPNKSGSRITDVSYAHHIEKPEFIAHGYDLTHFTITHWMPRPKSPKEQ